MRLGALSIEEARLKTTIRFPSTHGQIRGNFAQRGFGRHPRPLSVLTTRMPYTEWQPARFPYPHRDAPQLAVYNAPDVRLAHDGVAYTAEEFQQHYGHDWEQIWGDRAHTSVEATLESREIEPAAMGGHDSRGGNVSQLAADGGNVSQLATDAVGLTTSMLTAIRQQEAARGPPRSLHRLAREVLNKIHQDHTCCDKDLGNFFDWKPYVAAHVSCDKIVGSGITHAMASFMPQTRDHNRGGAPRLDFCFYRTDGSRCRVHPGAKAKSDAQLIFEHQIP